MSSPTCPICKHAVPTRTYAPFCSKRCADIDLQRWFSGAYAVPVVDAETPSDEAPAEAGRDFGDPL